MLHQVPMLVAMSLQRHGDVVVAARQVLLGIAFFNKLSYQLKQAS